MFSFCIPIYNCDLSVLTHSLLEQAFHAKIQFEIILIDDASEWEFKKNNSLLAELDHVVYIELEKNIGRSAIRNLFLEYAKYAYLIFIDCDSEVPDNQFVDRYFDVTGNKTEVICGGRIYTGAPKSKKLKLRWKYGSQRECKTACQRTVRPYHSFLSNNFLIRKETFKKLKFDERIKSYGHEDSLYGFALKQSGISVIHIENPLIHNYAEAVDEFLFKTREGIENLYFIYSEINPGENFTEMIKLLKTFCRIKNFYLTIIIAISYKFLAPLFSGLFKTGIVNLAMFDYYKLSYLCYYSLFLHKNGKRVH